METSVRRLYLLLDIRINCTLRNGNRLGRTRTALARYVLIVPCGMETCYVDNIRSGCPVLIVPCGMETTLSMCLTR